MENPDKNTEPEIIEDTADTQTEYAGMSKAKAAFFKILPMLIVLACTGLFMWGIKAVISVFFAPSDEVYYRTVGENDYTIVKCYQNPSSYIYIYDSDEFEYVEDEYDNVAGEHNDAHLTKVPIVYFVLSETAPDMETVTLKPLCEGNGLTVWQFDEFVLYRLEGQYGVFAPLRDYTESATDRKNDLYVVRQLLKDDNWRNYEMLYRTDESFEDILDKLEWYLDTEYVEDD